jgi:hypothetical protein
MTTYAEICEFLEEISEVSETIKNNLSIFKHSHDAPEPCQLVCSEPFNWVPNQIVETFVIEAHPLEISL